MRWEIHRFGDSRKKSYFKLVILINNNKTIKLIYQKPNLYFTIFLT